MLNKRCWYNLVINPLLPIFDKGWKLPHVDSNIPFVKRYVSAQIFSHEFLTYFNNVNLPINSALIFYKPAFYKNTEAHIDLINESTAAICAINWLFSGENSEMVWYNTPTSNVELKKTEAKTNYISWPVNVLEAVDKCEITKNKMTLVRVDIPHSINVDNEARWSISIRCKTNFKSWDDAVEYFENQKLIFK